MCFYVFFLIKWSTFSENKHIMTYQFTLYSVSISWYTFLCARMVDSICSHYIWSLCSQLYWTCIKLLTKKTNSMLEKHARIKCLFINLELVYHFDCCVHFHLWFKKCIFQSFSSCCIFTFLKLNFQLMLKGTSIQTASVMHRTPSASINYYIHRFLLTKFLKPKVFFVI